MNNLTLGDIEFVLDRRPVPAGRVSDANKFVLAKTPRMLAFYESLRDYSPENVLEIGMSGGGSLIYFDQLYEPASLVSVDLRTSPIADLERYVAGRPHIKTFYGRPQDHVSTRNAAQGNFPKGIDLVVDSGSHLLAQTKATFENIFPLVRPGGFYVIEDWAWSHRPKQQGADASLAAQPALSNLVFNLVVMTAISRVVDTVTVTEDLVCIKKGKGVLPAAKLDMSGHLRGKEISVI